MTTEPQPQITIANYQKTLTQAVGQLREFLIPLKRGEITSIPLDPLIERVTKFHKRFQARLTADTALGLPKTEIAEHLVQETVSQIHNLTAVLDEIQATQPKTTSAIDLPRAALRYNQRAAVLTQLLTSNLQLQNTTVLKEEHARIAEVNAVSAEHETWVPLQALSQKGSEDLLRIITRAIPVDPLIDEDISSLLGVFLRGAHTETAIQRLETGQQSLRGDSVALRALADSQQFRDVVAATFVPLFSRLLKQEKIEAYEDEFRNVYFTVVKEVQKYYQYKKQAQPPAPTLQVQADDQPKPTPAPIPSQTKLVPPQSAPPAPPSLPKTPQSPPFSIEPTTAEVVGIKVNRKGQGNTPGKRPITPIPTE
ncbi:hypothetical protein HYW32_02405 [Candidatus Berkelbacteria bacterium]|nr:hypothetical protein [Candidatus Berkelbacteria bacterium]